MNMPIRVVLADDDQSLANEMRIGLYTLGYEVVAIVFDGQQAVDACNNLRPDIAILDLEMPNLDGLSAAWQIVKNLAIPVIILTVHQDPDLIRTAVEFGVIQYHLKPISYLGLHAAIMTAIGKKIPLKGLKQSLEELNDIEHAKKVLMSLNNMSEHEAYQTLWAGTDGIRAPILARAKSIVETGTISPKPLAAPTDRHDVSVSKSSAIRKPISVFFSYSHRDKLFRDELDVALSNLKRQNAIVSWHDGEIGPGQDWNSMILEQLENADIILLMISQYFMSSHYCYDIELSRSLARHERGEAIVIPIILRPVDWKGSAFSHLQALPTHAKPVSTWRPRDNALLNIVEGIRTAINKAQGSKQ